MFHRRADDFLNSFFKFCGIYEEVGSEVASLVLMRVDKEAPLGGDELIHGWGVGGDDEGSAGHGFYDVVSPSF